MELPKVCATRPQVEDVEPGTYWWCSCGLSSQQPFCDGSHKGTEMAPKKVEIDTPTKVAWCLCKHSANGAFCDGSHAGVSEEIAES